ncbi:DNA repair protein RecO [Flavobacteriaceae bacterium AU392]|nr:DNA repair protein RecO [Flavobacteriaceae bacterium]RKM84684.1 DNA repair protein RecO [Flavobacteriaceae bacterium AU392]
MIESSKVIVLSKIRFKDHDLIVKCFTKAFGVKSYLLKGILKSKKGKFKAAYFQPLTLLDVDAEYKNNRTLHYLKDVKLKYHYSTIHTNIIKSSIAMFLSELLNSILIEEEKNEPLYNFIETSLIWFDENETYNNFHFVFLIELTKYLGFYPETPRNSTSYFNLEDGRFHNKEISNYCITGKHLTILKQILGTKFDNTKILNINSSEKREFLNMILLYFKLHLDGFKTPKSLSVLNQVYN